MQKCSVKAAELRLSCHFKEIHFQKCTQYCIVYRYCKCATSRTTILTRNESNNYSSNNSNSNNSNNSNTNITTSQKAAAATTASTTSTTPLSSSHLPHVFRLLLLLPAPSQLRVCRWRGVYQGLPRVSTQGTAASSCSSCSSSSSSSCGLPQTTHVRRYGFAPLLYHHRWLSCKVVGGTLFSHLPCCHVNESPHRGRDVKTMESALLRSWFFLGGGRRRVGEREALSARVVLVSPRALCLEVQHSTKKKFFRKSSAVHVPPKMSLFKKGLSFLRKVLVV